MTTNDFRVFYSAVHGGRTPFRWQTELLEHVAEDGWPETIELPTSSGKTSVIDIAVFLLAQAAGKSFEERRAPLRIFFVIDRRVVVDEAYEHSTEVAKALRESADPVVQMVSRELCRYGGRLPLQVSRMRGGIVRDSGWADEPNQPLVCLSTVDQVGSRLLFRGYQVNERTRSVHAGLTGIDSLIVLDEAHLSNAFADTLHTLKHRYSITGEKFARVVRMSATPGANVKSFRMAREWLDEDATTLKPRLTAIKQAELRDPKNRFEDEMVSAAKGLAAGIGKGVVGVIANTIASAREIFDNEKLYGDKVLLIGRNRPWCTEKLWEEYRDRIAARPDRIQEGLLYVVATQTVEVGANISFDALVTESAPVDALRQRFGRLNRLGLVAESKAIIVLRPKGDPVYREPTAETWTFLKQCEGVDFGVAAMDRILGGRDLRAMISRRTHGPLIFPGFVELWAQTNPAPEPDPEVAPFLHGPEALETADVQIVWRQNLNDSNQDKWAELIDLAPPLSREALAMPIAAVRRWLRGLSATASDIEGIPSDDDEEYDRKPRVRKRVVIWSSQGADGDKLDGDIRPGQTIVVPVTYGGADKFGWNVDSIPRDIFDEINQDEASRGLRKRIVRLDLAAADQPELQSLVESFREDRDDEVRRDIGARLNPDNSKLPRIDIKALVAVWPIKKPEEKEMEPSSEEFAETDDNSFSARGTLADHTDGVVEHARRYAAGCSLSAQLSEDIALAARLHDWGKCDERFQAWLAGRPFDGGKYLAKSGEVRLPAENARLRRRAGYPASARHEAASVMAACASGLLRDAHDRDLVLHLIGAHHGWGRPWFPVWESEPGFRVEVKAEDISFGCTDGEELARLDSGWVDRFESLNRRYGCWGLAFLEAILRRADCMQSQEEAERAAN